MAGMILKEDVEKVRGAADLYDIVSSTVTLKPSGSGTFMGLCPFHDEKTPSFSVRPSLGAWHCFGCGKGGDVFGYVEEQENIDFREAVELLADRYHIELHYEKGSGAPEHHGSKRARLLDANDEAQRFFVEQLKGRDAIAAHKLLAGRNFSRADCERFGCGYAPQGWDNLVRHLSNKGFTQQEMLDAGLARQGQRGIYDYFRGRATWPIRDSTGRTLGFGARKLFDDDTINAKYINTPDTVLYKKTQALYGIDVAKKAIVKKRQVVVVEGYTDVMACHLAGIDTAVATCGTAFGEEHAKIVRRLIADDSLGAVQLVGPLHVEGQSLSSRIVFTFDGDAAGQKAAIHAFGLDSAFLSQTFVAVAPDNLDPCDLRLNRGDEAVRSLIVNAKPLYDFVIDTVIGRFDTSFTTGQMGAVKASAPLIAQIRDFSLLDLYTRKATRRIGVDLEVMRREVNTARNQQHVKPDDAYAPRRGQYRSSQYQQAQRGGGDSYDNPAARKALERHDASGQTYYKVDDAVFIAEQQFMAVLIQVPRAVPVDLFAKLTPNHFATDVFRSLFQAVQAADGLPEVGTAQGLWMHGLNKAAGPMLSEVVYELAVLPLPLPDTQGQGAAQSSPGAGADSDSNESPVSQPLRPATPEESRYASELLVRLLDLGYMRQIGSAKRRMSQIDDPIQKLDLLGRITTMEAERKDMQAKAYGNITP